MTKEDRLPRPALSTINALKMLQRSNSLGGDDPATRQLHDILANGVHVEVKQRNSHGAVAGAIDKEIGDEESGDEESEDPVDRTEDEERQAIAQATSVGSKAKLWSRGFAQGMDPETWLVLFRTFSLEKAGGKKTATTASASTAENPPTATPSTASASTASTALMRPSRNALRRNRAASAHSGRVGDKIYA